MAEFAMRGRLQAIALVVGASLSLLFCWIGAAVMALVTLRKGAGQGAWLFAWALLPAGTLLYVSGDPGPLTLLIGTLVLALTLRFTVSLQLTLLASVAVGVLTGLVLAALGGAYLEQLVGYFSEFLARLETQVSKGSEPVVLPRPVASQVAGMLGAGTAMLSVVSLLLGRYWQAALYNPGGFGDEFKALRFPIGVSSLLVVGGLGLSSLGLEYRSWAMIFFIPLSFAGLALVHARVEARGQSVVWLTWFYVAWVVFDPVKLLVVFFAIADSWLNFRQRWAAPRGAGSSGTKVQPREEQDEDKDI